jgi:hypothetical protein
MAGVRFGRRMRTLGLFFSAAPCHGHGNPRRALWRRALFRGGRVGAIFVVLLRWLVHVFGGAPRSGLEWSGAWGAPCGVSALFPSEVVAPAVSAPLLCLRFMLRRAKSLQLNPAIKPYKKIVGFRRKRERPYANRRPADYRQRTPKCL